MIPLPIIAICSVGIFASVFKFIHDHIKRLKVDPLRHISTTQPPVPISGEVGTPIPTTFEANLVINDKAVTFIKEETQIYAHYDLAIDYCVQNGTGFLTLYIELLIVISVSFFQLRNSA